MVRLSPVSGHPQRSPKRRLWATTGHMYCGKESYSMALSAIASSVGNIVGPSNLIEIYDQSVLIRIWKGKSPGFVPLGCDP